MDAIGTWFLLCALLGEVPGDIDKARRDRKDPSCSVGRTVCWLRMNPWRNMIQLTAYSCASRGEMELSVLLDYRQSTFGNNAAHYSRPATSTLLAGVPSLKSCSAQLSFGWVAVRIMTYCWEFHLPEGVALAPGVFRRDGYDETYHDHEFKWRRSKRLVYLMMLALPRTHVFADCLSK